MAENWKLKSGLRTETAFLHFWRSLVARAELMGDAEPTLGAAKRAWIAHLAGTIAA